MSKHEAIKFDDGKVWAVSSYGIPIWLEIESTAEVVIPIDQLDGLTDKEIGQRVRGMIARAAQLREEENEQESGARTLSGILIEVGDIFPVRPSQEEKIAALEKRDGSKCHYCQHPLSRSYNRCVMVEYQAEYGRDGGGNYRRPGHYPIYESFTLDGCKPIQLDHKHPKAKGGRGSLDNLVLSCPECNRKKSHRFSYEDFMAMSQAVRP